MMNIDEMICKIDEIDTLSYSLESLLYEADVFNSGEKGKKVVHLFFVLQEQIENLANKAHELSGHIEVCNAVNAVNHVNELKAEIKRLKEK